VDEELYTDETVVERHFAGRSMAQQGLDGYVGSGRVVDRSTLGSLEVDIASNGLVIESSKDVEL
jgi:hypothetical protein